MLEVRAYIQEINYINPVIRGWYQYYGKFYKTTLKWLWRNLNHYLSCWVRRKYSKYQRHKVKACRYLANIAITKPVLFFHWKLGYVLTA
ncbi:group II intron maturase-specific domain-containing protein [Candidatus Tisiphia endosymbiont of Beris chalybata]|uniref:group II intron maturase-specific domain-containing protein n=1 Tax=Candidatus Tisiphia endosymbiont of Beris chalybata TaxID=3066262 RepID=UPI003977B6CB